MKVNPYNTIALTVNQCFKKKYFLSFFKIFISLIVINLSGYSQSLENQFPSLSFTNPVLISGVNNQVGAIYLFANVIDGVDAHVEIMGISGGASLSEIDNTTGAGYYDAFQPYVVAAANDTSYIDWKFSFKKAGESTDTILPALAITAIDVDGDGGYLKEFVQAATPGAFAMASDTYLTFSFDGQRSTVVSTVDNVPLIDTAEKRAMFQMNFSNVSTILYRNGAISNYGSEEIRQTCIYFKSFFHTYEILPVKLLSFSALPQLHSLELSWAVTSEDALKYYSVQKSTDAINWYEINTQTRSSLRDVNTYSFIDNNTQDKIVFYKLKVVNTNGSAIFSKVIKINAANDSSALITHNTIFQDAIHVRVSTRDNDEYYSEVYSISGQKIRQQANKVFIGETNYLIEMPANLNTGNYVLVIRNKQGQLIHTSKLVKMLY